MTFQTVSTRIVTTGRAPMASASASRHPRVAHAPPEIATEGNRQAYGHGPGSRPAGTAEPTPSVTDRHTDFGKPLVLGPQGHRRFPRQDPHHSDSLAALFGRRIAAERPPARCLAESGASYPSDWRRIDPSQDHSQDRLRVYVHQMTQRRPVVLRSQTALTVIFVGTHLNPLPEAVNDHDATIGLHSAVDDNLRYGRGGSGVMWHLILAHLRHFLSSREHHFLSSGEDRRGLGGLECW